jgi:predicted alpha-1,2-mannosidase
MKHIFNHLHGRGMLTMAQLLRSGSCAVLSSAIMSAGLLAATPFETQNLAQFVNPRYAACGSGNCVPGPRLPFGMVNLSPDCGNGSANSGYESGQPIYGFSHIHVSGTGGGPKYGNIPIMATTGDLAISNSSPYSAEVVSCNYYRANLDKYNIVAELTATEHAGYHKYTFPASSQAHIFIDAGGGLLHNDFGEAQTRIACGVTIVSDSVVKGFGTLKGGWNLGDPYTVYFYAVFSTPASSSGTWKGSSINSGDQSEADSTGSDIGAIMNFTTTENQTISIRVGISFISTEKAQANLAAEIPSWEFQAIVDSGVSKWNRHLSSILIEGATEAQKQGFYSALYRTFSQPADRTGENPKWTSSEPYYDDYYALWDTYRTLHPLITLTKESRQRDMVRSLIDIYVHEGYMPDSRSGNCNGRTQGGSTADIVLADAYVKGLTGIDWNKGYAAMLQDATVPPSNAQKEGRGGCVEYNALGYVPGTIERSGTRTIEYSTCDWGIARIALGLDKQDDFTIYKGRAGNWYNLWNPSASSDGFNGFIGPRNEAGEWLNFSPTDGGGWGSLFYEGSSWTYSFGVPQDVPRLITACGGNATFIARLDKFFQSYFEVGNEPGFITPFLYLWAGSYQKMVDRVIEYQRNRFNPPNCDGIPGNDDSGAMTSLFIWDELGLMPNAGWEYYLITSPVFPQATIQMENGRNFIIIAQNLSAPNKYVTAATLNGQPLNRAWITHDEIRNGAALVLTMGSSPSDWPNGPNPPSISTFTPTSIAGRWTPDDRGAGDAMRFSINHGRLQVKFLGMSAAGSRTRISLLSMSGQQLLSTDINTASSKNVTINLTNAQGKRLPSGTYLCRIHSGRVEKSFRFAHIQ